MPPVSGGSPGKRSVCSAAMVSRSAASGSPPVGSPTGALPSHARAPSTSVSIAAQRTPTNE